MKILSSLTGILPDSYLSILFQGGIFSLLVLGILALMSVISWSVICQKWFLFFLTVRSAKKFLKNVDLQNGLSDVLYRSELYAKTYAAKLFRAAHQEFIRRQKSEQPPRNLEDKMNILLRIERQIEKSIAAQNIKMESNLTILATISSSAPFIGLFGTVIGIIDAFYSIGAKGASSIAVVAPGISTALVATAFGLFSAIPALIAFNIFRNKTRIISNELRSFGLDLINLFDEEYTGIDRQGDRTPPETKPVKPVDSN